MRSDHPQSLNLTFTRITQRSNLLPHPLRKITRYPRIPFQTAVRMRKSSAKNRYKTYIKKKTTDGKCTCTSMIRFYNVQ